MRDEIAFGYNGSNEISAAAVLADGYLQCNTRATLLMALLRATRIACRLQGVTVDKRLQKEIVTGLFYRVAPRDIVHSWAEVHHNQHWVRLEGVILDQTRLDGIRATVHIGGGPFLGYAVGTDDLANPIVALRGNDTQIQSTAVNHDFGVIDDPDSFHRAHPRNEHRLKGLLRLVRLVARAGTLAYCLCDRVDHMATLARATLAPHRPPALRSSTHSDRR